MKFTDEIKQAYKEAFKEYGSTASTASDEYDKSEKLLEEGKPLDAILDELDELEDELDDLSAVTETVASTVSASAATAAYTAAATPAYTADETPAYAFTPEDVMPRATADEPTIIAKGTVIVGSVMTKGDVELAGELEGNITCGANLKLSGKITGDSIVGSIVSTGAAIAGNVVSYGDVHICSQSAIDGNVKAKNCQINGKVTGDLDVSASLVLGSTASVIGNIRTGTIEVLKGAIVKGSVTMGEE